MRISSPNVRDALLSSLADEYSRKILLTTLYEAKSVEDLSRAQNIPISTCYRRVNEMKELGLLIVEKTVLTEDGKKFELYRSAFRSIKMDFENGELVIDAVLNEDIATRMGRLWASLRSG